MKVITMESSAFTALTEQIAEIAAHVRAVSGGRKEESPDRLLTTREAAHLLNVSCRTLQRMRSEQRIAYVVLRGKCRYRQSEIDRLLEDSTVTGEAAIPGTKFEGEKAACSISAKKFCGLRSSTMRPTLISG